MSWLSRFRRAPPPPEGGLVIAHGAELAHVSRRGVRPSLIVLHESVTETAAGAVDVLRRRGLGVHFTVDVDGTVAQHAPVNRACFHAGAGRNLTSVAVEVVNRYYGAHAAGRPTLRGVWVDRGHYIVPPEEQLEVVWRLVQRVSAEWDIPVRFAGASGYEFRWGRVDGVTAGVSAHHRWAHADGLVPEHYCWARWHGLAAGAAYEATLAAAAAGARVTTLDVTEARA